jgi:hypothetical protein
MQNFYNWAPGAAPAPVDTPVCLHVCMPPPQTALTMNHHTLLQPLSQGNDHKLSEWHSVALVASAGSHAIAWPSNMAYKLPKGGKFKSVYMQIHYNNPEGVTDATDSSGFTAYATSKPREHECVPL